MRSAEALRSVATRRLAVAWRNRTRPSIHAVAALDVLPDRFRFAYCEDVESIEGFRPLVGFPDLRRTYESARLWPFFDLRVMDRKRPDFPEYVGWLGLPPDADRLDVLARAAGEQKGDTLLLAEAPWVEGDGTTSATFIVRGAGYAVRAFDSAAEAKGLRPGDTLELRDDIENVANPDALLLTLKGKAVGWVPDLLVDYAREVRAADCSVTVLQNNGVDSPWHSRLLVRLDGRVSPGWSPFSEPPWPPLPAPALQ